MRRRERVPLRAIRLALAALAVGPAACATTPATSGGETPAAGPTEPKTQTVCRYVKQTGSRLAREVCVEVPLEPDGVANPEQDISTEDFKRILQQRGPVRAVGRRSGDGG